MYPAVSIRSDAAGRRRFGSVEVDRRRVDVQSSGLPRLEVRRTRFAEGSFRRRVVGGSTWGRESRTDLHQCARGELIDGTSRDVHRSTHHRAPAGQVRRVIEGLGDVRTHWSAASQRPGSDVATGLDTRSALSRSALDRVGRSAPIADTVTDGRRPSRARCMPGPPPNARPQAGRSRKSPTPHAELGILQHLGPE